MRRQESWIASTTFNPPQRKLDFFSWYVVTKCDSHDWNSLFGIDYASYPISLMLHDCITYDINMTLLWWMGVAKSRYQFISSSWGFLSMVTPCFVSNIGNTIIRLYFLTISAEHLFRRAPFDGCLWQYIVGKTICHFSTNFNPLRKNCLRACLFPFWNTKY